MAAINRGGQTSAYIRMMNDLEERKKKKQQGEEKKAKAAEGKNHIDIAKEHAIALNNEHFQRLEGIRQRAERANRIIGNYQMNRQNPAPWAPGGKAEQLLMGAAALKQEQEEQQPAGFKDWSMVANLLKPGSKVNQLIGTRPKKEQEYWNGVRGDLQAEIDAQKKQSRADELLKPSKVNPNFGKTDQLMADAQAGEKKNVWEGYQGPEVGLQGAKEDQRPYNERSAEAQQQDPESGLRKAHDVFTQRQKNQLDALGGYMAAQNLMNRANENLGSWMGGKTTDYLRAMDPKNAQYILQELDKAKQAGVGNSTGDIDLMDETGRANKRYALGYENERLEKQIEELKQQQEEMAEHRQTLNMAKTMGQIGPSQIVFEYGKEYQEAFDRYLLENNITVDPREYDRVFAQFITEESEKAWDALDNQIKYAEAQLDGNRDTINQLDRLDDMDNLRLAMMDKNAWKTKTQQLQAEISALQEEYDAAEANGGAFDEIEKRKIYDELKKKQDELNQLNNFAALFDEKQDDAGFHAEWDRGQNWENEEQNKYIQTKKGKKYSRSYKGPQAEASIHGVYSYINGGSEYEYWQHFDEKEIDAQYQGAMAMLPDEKEQFNKLYNMAIAEGREPTEAQAFLDALQPYLNQRLRAFEELRNRQEARTSPVSSSVASAMNGMLFLPYTVATMAGQATGASWATDPNSSFFAPARYQGDVEGQVEKDLGEVGGFFYKAGMSAVKNFLRGLPFAGAGQLAGSIGTLSEFFGEAYYTGYQQKLEETGDPDLAGTYAFVDAGISTFFEIASVEKMFSDPSDLLQYLLQVGGAEMSEEFFEGVFSPYIHELMDGSNEWKDNAEKIIQAGGYEDENGNWVEITEENANLAYKKAIRDYNNQIAESVLSAGFSTLGPAGFGIVRRNVQQNNDTKDIGKTVLNKNVTKDMGPTAAAGERFGAFQKLNEAAQQLQEGTEARRIADEIAEDTRNGKKISFKKTGKLVRAIMGQTNEQIGQVAQGVLGDTLKQQLIDSGVAEEDAEKYSQVLQDAVTNGYMTPEAMLVLSQNEKALEMWKEFNRSEDVQSAQRIQKSVMDLIVTPAERTTRNIRENVAAKMAVTKYVTEADEELKEALAAGEKRTGSALEVVADGKIANVTGFGLKEQKNADGMKSWSVTVKLSNGEEVDIDQVKSTSENAAKVLQVVQGENGQSIGQNTALALMQLKSKDMIGAVTDAMNMAFGDVLGNAVRVTTLTTEEQQEIRKAMDKDNAEADAEAGRNAKILTPGKAKIVFDGVEYGTKAFSDKLSGMSKEIRDEANFVAQLMKSIGMSVDFYYDDSEEGSARQGAFIGTEGIRLNLAGTFTENGVHRSLVATAAHEATHWLRANSPKAYRQLQTYALRAMEKAGYSLQNELERIQANYAHYGEHLTLDKAAEEMTAMGCEQVFTDEKLVSELRAEDPSLYGKVRKAVRRVVDMLRRNVTGVRATSSRYARSMQKTLEELARVWKIALDQAKSAEGTGEGTGTSNSIRIDVHDAIMDPGLYNDYFTYENLTNKSPIKVTKLDINNNLNNREEYINAGIQNAEKVGFKKGENVYVHVEDTDTDVMVTKKSMDHTPVRLTDDQRPIFEHIGEMLKNAKLYNTARGREGNQIGTYMLLSAGVMDDGTIVYAAFNVNKYTHKLDTVDVLYSVKTENKEAASSMTAPMANSRYATASEISIAEAFEDVKNGFANTLPKDVLDHLGVERRITKDTQYLQHSFRMDEDYMVAVERGDMETAQEIVDKAAEEAGYTELKYHGTYDDFNEFDASKGLFGGSGLGFYFGNDFVANQYANYSTAAKKGRVIKAYLDTSNIATDEDHKITPDMVKEAMKRLKITPEETYLAWPSAFGNSVEEFVSKHGDREIAYLLEKWGYYGGVREKYYSEYEGLDPIFTQQEMLDIMRDTLKYDGIRNDFETVVWDNKLIKSADAVTYDDDGNVIPPSERFDRKKSDIRWSMQDDETREKEEIYKITERKANNILKENGEIAYAPAKYSFAGERAENRYGEDVRRAYVMAKEGATDEQIREETNCIRGFNGRWWRILDNNNMKLTIELENIEKGKNYKLGDIYDAEELFKAYPNIQYARVIIDDFENNYSGATELAGNFCTIKLNTRYCHNNAELDATIQHELQHLIQWIEKSNNGANVTFWKDMQDMGRARIANNDREINRLLQKVGIDDRTELAWGIEFNPDGTIDEEYLFPEELEKVRKMPEEDLKLYKALDEDNKKWLKLLEGNPSPKSLYMNTVGEIEARAASEKTDKNTKLRYPSNAVTTEEFTGQKVSTPGESVKFSMRAPVEERADGLIAMHNLNATQFMQAMDLGGFAMPSIAVVKASMGHSKYGDISVVFYPNTIDPKASKSNKVYSGDAWTPTYPTIEYKIDSKKLDKIVEKIERLVPREVLNGITMNSIDETNTTNAINSARGDYVKALENNLKIKLAYLAEKGIEIEYPMREQALANYFTNEEIRQIVEELGEEKIREANRSSSKYLEEHPEIAETMRKIKADAWNKEIQKKIGNQETVLKMLKMNPYEKEKWGYSYTMDGLYGAVNYLNRGIKQEVNQQELKEVVAEKLDEDDYKEWLQKELSGIIQKSGIRNNKNYYTDYGNPRSWEALHDEETLENVVKIMRQQDDKGENSFFTQSKMLAVGTKDFKSLDEIRKHSGQLRMMEEEEYNAAKSNIVAGFSALMDEMSDKSERNYLIARDRALEAMVEAVRRNKTPEGIENELRQWHGLYVREGMGQEIADLMKEISELPTGYFEAKPKRAVTFDEIEKVVVPETASQELKDRMDERGIPWETYDGTEEDRLRVLNKQENAMFSIRDDTDYDVRQWLETVPEWSLQTEAEKQLLGNYKSLRVKQRLDLERMRKIDNQIKRLEEMQKAGEKRTAEDGNPVKTVTVEDVLKENGIVQDGAMLKKDGVIIGSLKLGVLSIYDKYKELRKKLQESGAFTYDERLKDWTSTPQNIHADGDREIRRQLEDLQIKKQNLQKVMDQQEEKLAKITMDEGFGKMMYQQNKVLDDLQNFRTQQELVDYVAKMEKAAKKIAERIDENRKAVDALAKSDVVKQLREILGTTTAAKAAEDLKREYHSTWTAKQIGAYLEPIILKMKTGEDFEADVETLAGILVSSDSRNRYDTLESLRGLTITLGKGAQRELKAQNSSLKEVRARLAGTGITVKYGERSTLEADIEDLRAEYPMIPELGDEKDALGNFLNWIDSMKSVSAGMEFYDQRIAEAMAVITGKAAGAANGIYMPNDPKAQRQVMKMMDFVKGLNAETAEAQKALADIAAEMAQMKQTGLAATNRATTLMRDVNVALDYYKKIGQIAVDEAKQKKQSSVIEQLKSKHAEEIVKNNAEWRAQIQRDKDSRDQLEENRKYARQINTALKRTWNLLKNPKGLNNVPEYMQGLAREVISMFVNNDMGRGSRFLQATQDELADRRRILDAWEKQSGKYNPNDLNAAQANEFVALTVQQDLLNIRDGLEDINRQYKGKNKLDTLQHRAAILKTIQEAVSEIYSAIKAEQEVQIGDRRVKIEDAAYAVAQGTNGKKYREWTGSAGQKMAMLHKFIVSGNMTPEYFFRTLGNAGLSDLWDNYHWAENRNGLELKKAKDRLAEIAEKHGYKDWDMKQKITLNLESGDVEITLGQAMSLWATWKREKTLGPEMSEHLTKGGFYADVDLRDGLLGRATVEKRAHKVTEEDMQKVHDLLTKEQRYFVDDVVLYMSRDMSQLGNAASMAAYGIKLYKESYYFPFKMWDGVKNRKSNDAGSAAASQDRAFHPSFSKSRTHGANNAVMIGDFLQTATDHIAGMINYATMGLANESLNKVLNQQTAEGPYESKRNTRAILEEAYGKEALQYLMDLKVQLEGGAVKIEKTFYDKLISLFRKNAVAGSLSVALQQPLSYIRAAMMINPKYLTAALNPATWKGSYQEMIEHSGVAVIKNMGRFDMNFGQSAREYLTPQGKESTGRKIWNGIEEYSTILPELMDKMTWTRMWSAIKAEQHAEHPEMDVKSEDFLNLCGERFNELMRRTQVYDSTLVKSANMRSQSTIMKSLTSFMAEPTLTLNVLADATRMVKQGEKGGKVMAAKAAATFFLSAVLQAAVKGIMGSGRSPDEKKTWWENFLYRFEYNFLNEADPLQLIPGFSDLITVLKGGELKDDAYGTVSKLIKAISGGGDILTGNSELNWRNVEDSAAQIMQLFTGVPAKNIMRDLRAIWNWTIEKPYAERATDPAVLSGQFADLFWNADNMIGVVNKWLGEAGYNTSNTGYYQRIYEAKKNGNEQQAQDMIDYLLHGKGVKEDTISGKVAGLARKDENASAEDTAQFLIAEGANAEDYIKGQMKDGKLDAKAARELLQKADPKKDADSIWWTVDRIQYQLETNAEKVSGNYYRLWDAMDENKANEIRTAVKTMLEHGMEPKNIKTQITKQYKDAYLKADSKGKIKIRDAIEKAYKELGFTKEDADKVIDKWK